MVDNSKALTMSREKMASYVHDVAEMEAKEFALAKLRKEIAEKSESNIYIQEGKIEECEYEIEHCESEFNKLSNEFINKYGKDEFNSMDYTSAMTEPKAIPFAEEPRHVYPPEKPKLIGNAIMFFTFLYIPAVIVGIILVGIASIVSEQINIDGMDMLIPAAGLAFLMDMLVTLYVTISGAIEYRSSLKNYNIAIMEYNDKLEKRKRYIEYLQELEKYELYQKLNEARALLVISKNEKQKQTEKLKDLKIQKTACESYCEHINKQIEIIEKNKNSLYTLNIIPPDYRTFDCAMQLDHMFRNGHVDTMKEAVVLYDERVFRGDVIKGIDKIYTMLGQLAQSMSAIEYRLTQIRDEVRFMGDEVFRLAENVKESSNRNVAMQEKLLDESRATRYATESVKESNKKLEWYLEQRRQGLI